MVLEKTISGEKGNKYNISITEEYLAKKYPEWEKMSGSKQRETLEIFMLEIEKFISGTAAIGISSMSFMDENLELKQAITISPFRDVPDDHYSDAMKMAMSGQWMEVQDSLRDFRSLSDVEIEKLYAMDKSKKR